MRVPFSSITTPTFVVGVLDDGCSNRSEENS
jgi:hypothetical protein